MDRDIDRWLEDLGLARYQALFAESELDLDVLPELTEDDLKDLGVPLGPRKKLMKAISALATSPQADVGGDDRPPPRRDDGERRQLTVMFCDLVDSTALSTRLDPEDLRDVVRAYHDACARAVARYDGYVAKYLGDGVLVYFGYPRAHENDAGRAARAGLAIVEVIAALRPLTQRLPELSLAVRVGIDTGPVVVGDIVGEGPAEQAGVIGETPNVAARLQALARPGQVVVGPLTRALLGEAFACEDLGAQSLKGLAQPLRAWRVVRERDEEGEQDWHRGGGKSQLVGRNEELGLLARSWQASRSGHGQVVLIQGEAGIGKSRLVEALREQAANDEHAWVATRCSPYHTNSSLHPVIEHLKRVMAWAPDDDEPTKLGKLESALAQQTLPLEQAVPLYAELLSLPLPEGRYASLPASTEEVREQTLDALVAWLIEEAERRPVLRVWEDLHWADPTTLALLALCIEQSPTVSLMNVLTYRPDFVPPWSMRSHMTPITLGRLERAEVQALIVQRAGGKAMPDEVAAYVVDKTDGVPLYVEELTKAILDADFVLEDGGRYRLARSLSGVAIPPTLQDLLMARLDRLPTVREIAQLGSILGREFAYEMLQAIASLETVALQDGLDRLVDAELLYQRGRRPNAKYVFKHALVQDAAYQSLLRRTRQYYHRQVGELLESRYPDIVRTQPELVAHHYSRAEEHAKATRYLMHCAERSAAMHAHAEAVAALEQARTHASQLPEGERDRTLLALAVRQAHSLHFLGRREAIVELLLAHRASLARVGDPALAAELHFWLGFAHGWLGHRQEAAESLLESLDEARAAGDKAIMGRVHRALATECVYSGKPLSEAIAHARDAASLLRDANDTFWLAQALFTLSYCCTFAGDFGQALDAARELAVLGDANSIGRARANAAMAAGLARATRGEGEAGIELCTQAQRISPDRFETAFILACLGKAHLEARHTARAVAALREAVEVADQVRSLQFRAWFRTMLSEALLLDGDASGAGVVAGEALAAAAGAGFRLGVGLAKQALGRVAAQRGDHAESARDLEEALVILAAIGARFEAARARLALAALAEADGDHDAARAQRAAAREAFVETGAQAYVAPD